MPLQPYKAQWFLTSTTRMQ